VDADAARLTPARLRREEELLRFDRFDFDMASALGTALVEAARTAQLAVAIDIRRNGQQLFHAAFPVAVRGVGVVGTVGVSGLPEVEDHTFLVEVLSAFLGVTIPSEG
jgi:uncharacterized protein (UPF0303 family)